MIAIHVGPREQRSATVCRSPATAEATLRSVEVSVL
ncbi:MAG: hypothetical protein GPOALKHO_000549 [Sodalis sp.]|nr:MAG: hypothetical protein GPOALKHO_000549 [Sodalis sp.]